MVERRFFAYDFLMWLSGEVYGPDRPQVFAV